MEHTHTFNDEQFKDEGTATEDDDTGMNHSSMGSVLLHIAF